MRVVISGGLGFMGRALGARLAADGDDVRLMDVADSAGTDYDYVRGSVLNAEDCERACQGVDAVVHGAAIHDARQVARDPLAAIAINVTGTINLFDAATRAGARRFVFMSSAKVYGDPSALPSGEQDVLAPKESYALSKVAGEHHLRLSQRDSGMSVVIVRPFSVYGPGQNLGSGYVGMVLKSILGEHRVDLPGEEGFVRDFVHIDDATRLSVAAIRADALPGVTIVNAGCGQVVSLAQLVATASQIVGYELPIDFSTPGPETLKRTHADMKFAAEQFNFTPSFALAEGLGDTMERFLWRDTHKRPGRGR